MLPDHGTGQRKAKAAKALSTDQLWGRKVKGQAVWAQGQVGGLKGKKVFFYTPGTGFSVLSYPAFLREDSLAEMMVLVNLGGWGIGSPAIIFSVSKMLGGLGRGKMISSCSRNYYGRKRQLV